MRTTESDDDIQRKNPLMEISSQRFSLPSIIFALSITMENTNKSRSIKTTIAIKFNETFTQLIIL